MRRWCAAHHLADVKTGEGDLYEIDTALRPNGNAGLLVTSFDALRQLPAANALHTAWTWDTRP